VHLVGFTIEIYYDARSYKRQTSIRAFSLRKILREDYQCPSRHLFTHVYLKNFRTYATEDFICRIVLIVLKKNQFPEKNLFLLTGTNFCGGAKCRKQCFSSPLLKALSLFQYLKIANHAQENEKYSKPLQYYKQIHSKNIYIL
jgi:hypothetical protein